jgi:uncharacterized protein (TIGR00106 family)
MIVADIRAIPIGSGTSLSQHIKAVYNILDEEKVRYIPGPMSTAVEVDSLDDLFDIIELLNQVLVDRGVQRILTTVNIDYRLDKEISMESKLKAARTKQSS